MLQVLMQKLRLRKSTITNLKGGRRNRWRRKTETYSQIGLRLWWLRANNKCELNTHCWHSCHTFSAVFSSSFCHLRHCLHVRCVCMHFDWNLHIPIFSLVNVLAWSNQLPSSLPIFFLQIAHALQKKTQIMWNRWILCYEQLQTTITHTHEKSER